ncbi:hypothetical protein V2J09_021568 [Rumex salicifolius]
MVGHPFCPLLIDYHAFVDSLSYLSLTRLDVAISINKLSMFMHKPNTYHWASQKCLLRFLANNPNRGTVIPASFNPTLHAYSDADWANNKEDFVSTIGCLLYLGSTPISWCSHKMDPYTPKTSLYQRLNALFMSLQFWQSKRMKMKTTIRVQDQELERSMDEAITLLAQLSSLQTEEVGTLDNIKDHRSRVYKAVMCVSPSVFVPSTPEYIEIYDKFKLAKYWQPCSDGDYELSFLKAEAARISASVGTIIPRGMDINSIIDWHLESVIASFCHID